MATHTIDLSQWKPLPSCDSSIMPRSRYDIVRDFVRGIDSEITVTFFEDDFYAVIGKKVVNLTFEPNEFDYIFDAFIRKRFGISINPFLIGLLHEVGHIITFDEQLDRERSVIYYLLNMDFDFKRYRDFTNMYFAIPSEFEATRWGVEYYLSNKEFCDNFLREIGYEA